MSVLGGAQLRRPNTGGGISLGRRGSSRKGGSGSLLLEEGWKIRRRTRERFDLAHMTAGTGSDMAEKVHGGEMQIQKEREGRSHITQTKERQGEVSGAAIRDNCFLYVGEHD